MPCEKPLWLLISKDENTGEIKYSLCIAAEGTSLEKLAKMQSSRYWVERAFQDLMRIVEWINTWLEAGMRGTVM